MQVAFALVESTLKTFEFERRFPKWDPIFAHWELPVPT